MSTRYALLSLAVLCLSLCSCGGGGAAALPTPNYPAAVDSLSEDDFLASGLPALPSGTSAVSTVSPAAGARGASIFGSDACKVISFSWAELRADVNTLNLQPTSTGLRTDVPDSTTSRIIAWALIPLPLDPGYRIRSVSLDIQPDPALRVFPAYSNFSRLRWEPGRRLTSDPGDSGTIYLSAGPEYNRENGSAYLLLAVAHPGSADMSGHDITIGGIQVTSCDVDTLAEGYAEGTPGAMIWGDPHIEGRGNSFSAENASGAYTLAQHFGAAPSEDLTLLLSQPLQFISGDEFFGCQDIGDFTTNDTGGPAGYLFYDPQELNGPLHPYSLTVNGLGGNDTVVNAAPLVVPPGGTEPNAIIAVLIGLLLDPVAGAQVSVTDGTSNTIFVGETNARGQIVLPGLDAYAGQDLDVSFNFGLLERHYVAHILEEEGIYYYSIEPGQAN